MNESLFICRGYYLMVFETKESACREDVFSLAAAAARDGEWRALKVIKYWNEYLKEKVIHISPNEPILLISRTKQIGEKPSELWHVLIGENVGWTRVLDWMEIRPLKIDNA